MSMDSSIAGKVALVTGAGSGIGQATATLLASRGAKVAVVARGINGQRTVDEIRAAGGTAELVSADMRNGAALEAMVRRTVELFGGLDIAVNNAGMTGSAARLHEQCAEGWSEVIATNLTAVFLCMKHEITQMLASGGGVIVNNASGSGVMPQPFLSPYAAAKHGVLGITKTAAREYAADGIRINSVCPGLTLTPQLERYFENDPGAREPMLKELPMRRMGTATEIANAIVWLCSPESSYVSGESLFVDGALACR